MHEITNVELLYQMHDRSVPAQALRDAEELDRRGVGSGVFTSDAEPPKPRFKSVAELVDKMAQVMIERSTSSGACTDDHLIAAGFKRAEIEDFRGDAAARAARLTADSVREKIKASKARRGGKRAVVG